MSARIAAITVIALAALAVPAGANAVPAPDPPPPVVHESPVDEAVRMLQVECPLAPT
jgi:hypothetical protein